MNYVKEDKAFRSLALQIGFRTTEIALWDNLFHQWNQNGFAEWFPAKNDDLTASGKTMTIPTMHRARNTLKQYGLINFKQQGINKQTWYKMSLLFEDGDADYELKNEPGDWNCLKAFLIQSLRHPLRHFLRQPLTNINNKQETINDTNQSKLNARAREGKTIPIFKLNGEVK